MTLKVLIVDDNRPLAENIAEILEDEGYVVSVAETPSDAIELAKTFPFDAALLDVRMPGMDGIDLHHVLFGMRPAARYFLMTAYAKDDRINEGLRGGIRAVLPKPVPIEALLSQLPAPDEAGGYVLIIEDDTAFGESLVELLETAGYQARWARSVATAREAVGAEAPTTIIADVRLPDGDGIMIAEELHEKTHAPVVLMSAFSTMDAERLVREHYGEGGKVLNKPFPPTELLHVLSKLSVGTRA